MPTSIKRGGAELWLDFVRRRGWSILAITMLTAAAAAAWALTRPPVYQASSLVIVDVAEQRGPAQDVSGNPFASNNRPLAGELFLVSTSTELRERVSETLEGVGVETGGRGLPDGVSVSFDVVDPSLKAVGVFTQGPTPEVAALVANVYADSYIELTQEAQGRILATTRDSLNAQAEAAADQLAAAEARERSRAYSGGTGGGLGAGQVASLQAALDQAQTQLDTRRATLRSLQADLAAVQPQIAERIATDDSGRLVAAREELSAVQTQRDLLAARYPDIGNRDARVTSRLSQYDADVQRLQTEIADLSARMAATTQTGGESQVAYAASLRREIQQTEADISALSAQTGRLRSRIGAAQADARRQAAAGARQMGINVEQGQLAAARQTAERAYLEYRGRLLQSADPSSAGYVQMLQRAAPIPVAVNVAVVRTSLVGGFLGLVLGLALALARTKLDNRIYTESTLREFGYPVLATVPVLPGRKKESWLARTFLRRRARRGTNKGRQLAPSLVGLLAPQSVGAESYRYLLANLLRSGTQSPRVVLVTGAGTEDGKSTTAANLAVAAAASGRRTLLLDADIRRPSLHNMLDLPVAPGLTDRLSGGDVEPVQVGFPNLMFVPAGSPDVLPVESALEVLSTAAAAGALDGLREHIDLIVIDSPPLLATADALYIAPAADAVLVVVRAGQTREGEVDHVLGSLEQVGANVTGFVFNGFELSMAYGYRHRYRSYSMDGLYSDYARGRTVLARSVEEPSRGDGTSSADVPSLPSHS